MNTITITIPQYPTKVQLSATRRAKYITKFEKIPKKYQNDNFIFKSDKLFNVTTKKFVARNETSRGKPRFVAISGNNLYSRMHERVRMKVMTELKQAMKPYLPDKPLDLLIGLPIRINMKVYRTVSTGSWDLDNFNIFYFKAFFDLLRDEHIIPDDSIQYIVAVGSEFIPISNDDDRKLEFIFVKETKPEITKHLLYQSDVTYFRAGKVKWNIALTSKLDTGKLMIDYDTHTYYINIGKRFVVWNALEKVLISIAVQALILNEPINVTPQFHKIAHDKLQKIMFSHHIPVYINGTDKEEWVLKLFEKTKI